MRKRSLLGVAAGIAVVAVSLGFALPGRPGNRSPKPLAVSAPTQRNLIAAMHGEAFAYLKYLRFSHQARRSGDPRLARLFARTAQIERMEHFRELAELAGLVGDNAANLKDAIAGEHYESTTMYPRFAAAARAAGDAAAAERFAEIGRDEGMHGAAFAAALRRLQAGRK